MATGTKEETPAPLTTQGWLDKQLKPPVSAKQLKRIAAIIGAVSPGA